MKKLQWLVLFTALSVQAAPAPEGSGAAKEYPPKAEAAEPAKDAKRQPEPTPVPITIVETGAQVESRAAEQQGSREHEQADLQAQQNMAVSAESMARASWAAAFLSAVAVGLLFVTWKETRVAARAAEATVKAMEAAECPYLVPSVTKPPDWPSNYTVVYSFMNGGRSPAVIRRFQDAFRMVAKLPTSPDDLFAEKWDDRKAVYTAVAPDFALEDQERIAATVPEADRPLQNAKLVLACRVLYEDLGGSGREQRFCWRFKKDGGQVTWYRVGGDAYNYDRPVGPV